MKKQFLYIFIIVWIGILTITNVFVTNNRTENLHQKIDNISDSLTQIKNNNSLALYTIKNLEKEVQKYKNENNILQSQKDSILLSFKAINTKNHKKLNEIKKQQKELNKLLEKLRKENEKYQ